MVKANNRDIPQLLQKLSSNTSCVLIYGPDEGLVRERGDIISKQIVADLNDPFNVVRPDMSEISEHPSLLSDELASLSMLGDKRLIRLDHAGDKAVSSCGFALEVENTDNLLVITAGPLPPRSKLRKLFETAPNALALPCYADSARDIEALVFEVLNSYGLRIEAPAVSYLISTLGNDRSVTRGEIEKLALYKSNSENKEITLSDAKAVIGDNNALTISEVVNAIAGGQPQKLDRLLDRAISQGENPIAILRVLQKHLQQLHFVKGLVGEGLPLETALKKLVPNLFFKEKDAFKAQLSKWTPKRLSQAMSLCQKAEKECKTTGMPDQAICARLCLSLSVRAAQTNA